MRKRPLDLCNTVSHPTGLRLLVVLLSKDSEPVEHGLGRCPQEERDAMHGNAIQIQEHRVDLHDERLAA
jgi:hypothetical protein